MIVKELKVPQVEYLSDWREFDKNLPHGKVIINKVVCGCGMTNYYLSHPAIPVILASPRRELISSKLKDTNLRYLHYFDRTDSKKDLAVTKDELEDYVNNPFQPADFVPKILCTYDSLKNVIEVLEHIPGFEQFKIIGDEATCIFTDARLKGAESLELLKLIDNIQNDCVFVTATPLKEEYLDRIPVFNTMTYINMIWPKEKIQDITLEKNKMRSTQSAILDIINQYRIDGYFATKIIDGVQVFSTEAVFFLNSIKDIVAIVKQASLSSDDTRVICADDAKNPQILKKVGLSIGHFPDKSEYKQRNKTFTFATRCSFEGADLYSDSASVYIFADSNRETLSLDISIDLPQIIGRCRTAENPFRHDIKYYYKTTAEQTFNYNVSMQLIQSRIDRSNKLIAAMTGCTDDDIIDKFKDAQKTQKYLKDYVDVVTDANGNTQLITNALVTLADIRAAEIKKQQYENDFTVQQYLIQNAYRVVNVKNTTQSHFHKFLSSFTRARSFIDRMKIYIEGCKDDDIRKQAEASVSIPIKFKQYYRELGADRCHALNYREPLMYDELQFNKSREIITHHLMQIFNPNIPYERTYIKERLQEVYNALGINKTAKATDIMLYFENVAECKTTDINGKRNKCFKILK